MRYIRERGMKKKGCSEGENRCSRARCVRAKWQYVFEGSMPLYVYICTDLIDVGVLRARGNWEGWLLARSMPKLLSC